MTPQMTRPRPGRVVPAAAVLAALPLGAGLWMSQPSAPGARAAITLVYVGAEECAPCRAWQRTEGKQFMQSAEFSRLNYREVKSPTARDLLKDEYRPDDLRGHRDSLGRGAGVPLWLVISDDRVVERGFGASQWHAAVLPRLRSLLR